MKKIIGLLSLLSLLIVGCNEKKQSKEYEAKYIFFFVGDGMGIQQVNTAKTFADSVLKDTLGIPFTKFPVATLSSTYAANRYITCSAAAGTALSTGSKTSIGTIGLNANHTDTLFSIAKKFKENGRKVAILTSVSIDHATPAAFYAHKGSRSSYYEIAKDLLFSNYDFFASGGFLEPNGSKKDTVAVPSIYQLGIEKGIGFASNFSVVDSLRDQGFKSIVYSAPNPAPSSTLQYAIDKKSTDISLADITQKAIEVVNNPNGFFIMVEGGKIDWACHDNDAATVVNEVIGFSKAINVALDFYKKHPNETLIVVTADHETGGMSLGNEENGYKSFLGLLQYQKASQERLHEIIANIKTTTPKASFKQVLDTISFYTGLSTSGDFALTKEETADIKKAYDLYFGTRKTTNEKNTYSQTDQIAETALAILNRKAGIGWTSDTHTGSPVPVFCIGVGDELFKPYLDNTDIPKNILIASGLK